MHDERVRAAFVYANPRGGLVEQVRAGEAPDTGLLGQNHLAGLGVDARIHEPALRRVARGGGLRHRLTWNLREVTLPWELRDAAVAVTPLARVFPLAARVRRNPRVLALNISLCTAYDRSSRSRRAALRAALRQTAGVVCFASAQRDRLLEQTGLPAGRVHTVLLGVDATFYGPEPRPDDGYVLAVGRDLARDYATFAAAVERARCRAVIVASARNFEGIRLPEGVDVRLDVTYRELRDLYAGAAAVVVPTRAESYPYGADCSGQTVLLEAMAAGRPVVLSERSTLDDYVRRGDTGLTVPPEDPAALAAAIERVLGDTELADRLARAARELVEERLTTRHLAERLAPLIRRTADGPA